MFVTDAVRSSFVVAVPPGAPVVTDDKGRVVERGQSRRYREGQMLQLTCRSSGGQFLDIGKLCNAGENYR